MKTNVGSIFFHIGEDGRAEAWDSGVSPHISFYSCERALPIGAICFYGATLPEAQRIADAINAAIDGAKARAAADADALKIAAQ